MESKFDWKSGIHVNIVKFHWDWNIISYLVFVVVQYLIKSEPSKVNTIMVIETPPSKTLSKTFYWGGYEDVDMV